VADGQAVTGLWLACLENCASHDSFEDAGWLIDRVGLFVDFHDAVIPMND
jgi:hypothetical protein